MSDDLDDILNEIEGKMGKNAGGGGGTHLGLLLPDQ